MRLSRSISFLSIILFLLFTASCMTVPRYTAKNEKGEAFKQDADDHVLAKELTDEQEVFMGQYFDATVAQEEWTFLEKDHPMNEYVSRVGQKLVQGSSRQGLLYTFKVVNEPAMINAFAMMGGFMYVGSGLLGFVNSEEELAGVLAHEISHIELKHSVKRFRKQIDMMRLNTALAGIFTAGGIIAASKATQSYMPAGSDLSGRVGGSIAGAISEELLSAMSNAIYAKHTISQEREADQNALSLLIKAGYSPDASAAYFYKMKWLEDVGKIPKPKGFLATHPATEERIQNVENFKKQQGL